MKKKFTILMMLLSLIGGVNLSSLRAQTDVTFNFNDASLEGWETFQGPGAAAASGSCPNWQISPTLTGMFANYYKGLENTNCIVSLTCDASNGVYYKPDNYIVTESAYTVTESTIVSWYVKAPSGSEYYELLVSSDKEEWTAVFSEELPVVSSATQKQSDLSEYAGQTLYIGFRHYGESYNTNGSHISVDEIVFGSVISGGSTPDPDPEPEEPTIPAAPTLTAEATGQTTIALSWDAVNGATSYNVYNNETVIASELTVTSYEVTGLTANTEYCYTVTAVNEIGESEKSAETCVTTWAPAPATPTGLTATAVDDKSITLAWTASQYATTYNIYDNNSVFIAEVTETTYTVTGLDAETEYCFAVSAENSSGESVATQAVCATTLEFVVPDEPVTKTIGTGNTTGRMPANMYSYYSVAQQIFTKEEIDFVPGAITKISFQASSTYAYTRLWTIYMVNVDKESFDGNNDWVSVTNADIVYDGTITTGSGWLEINLQNSFIYTGNDIVLCVYDHTESEQIFNFYTDSNTNQTLKYDSYYPISVDALNGNGSKYQSRSQFRFVIEAADEIEPAIPTNLAATANDDGTITLTWDAAENAMSYNVYSGEEQIGATNGTTYTVDNLEEETEYCFTVKSVRFQNVSDASVEVCATTVEQPVTIEFVLTDSYGDGWSGGKLNVSFDDGVTPSKDMTVENGSSATYEFTVGKCTFVSWVYTAGDWPSENSFVIRYKDGADIYSSGSMTSAGASGDFLTTCDMEQPQNLVADNTELHSGETTTITWDAYEGAVSYNIYVNGVKVNEEAVTEPSYELTDLSYNVNPGNKVTIKAVDENENESPSSNIVYVKMAGSFPLTVIVENGNEDPIAGATLNIEGYDEYEASVEYTDLITDAEGKVVIENMPLLAQNYNYFITASASPYKDSYIQIYHYDISNNVNYTATITMALQTIESYQIESDKEYYVAGEDIILYWDAVEGATGYNVYEKYYDAEYNEVFTKLNGETLLTSTLYIIEDGLQYRENGNTICVTAVYDDLGESEKGYGKSINVNDYGTVTGVVTDGANAIEGATVTIEGRDQFNNDQLFTFTTAEDGTFSGDVLYGDKWGSYTYTATISKSGYETQVVENVIVTFGSPEYEFEPIVLTAEELPEATINNLTATVNNSQVDISWVAEYDSYNVYRNEASVGAYQLGTTSTESYSDTDWAELPNGSYYYGVAAMIYQGMGAVIEENCEAMEFQPDWTTTDNWYFGYSNIGTYNASLVSYNWYSGGEKYYMILPPMSPANSSLTFSYLFDYYDYYSGSKELDVYYATSEDGPWTNLLFHKTSTEVASDTWHESGEIDLSAIEEETIYIAFCHTDYGFGPMYIDNIVVNGPIYEESEITWTSSAIVKNDANVFTGTGNWTTEANWSKGVPASGATVFIEGNVTIASDVDVNVNNMTINGGSVTINKDASLTVNGTLVNEAAANLVINDGAQIFQNNEDVPATFVMGITIPEEWQSDNTTGWQFISSPFTNASVFNFTNASEGNYDLFKYDGDEDLEWQNHKANAASFGLTFEQGVGYLASHETESTIELTGTLNADNSYSWDYLYYNEEKPLANFYLLGNPFTFDMDITKATFTNLVEGVAVVTSVGGYDYSQTTIPVGDAFFVKANDYSSSLSYGGRGARSAQSNSLNITATGNAGKDNVVINFAGKSEGFDKLQNFNDAIATVYVAEDGKNYGIYNCDADVQEVELSFNANKMGNYTISIEPNGKFQTVTLVDHFTGVETNMLEGEYTFTAMSGDNHNRFVVRFANGQESTDDSHFVYQSGEELILNIQGDVQIVDVLGRVVYSGEAMNDINRINVSSFNSGAYMVRVMNGNDVKVEKVVIY